MSVLSKVCLTHYKRDTVQELTHAPITGVAPGAMYDPTIEFFYDDDTPTVKRAAASPAATVKMPVIVFAEVSA